MIICIDIDHTICRALDGNYAKAIPYNEVINKILKHKVRGDTIILHTARGMLSYKGDVDKIKDNREQELIDWLRRNKVPYDKLVFGKPYADVYIDDKALRPTEWVAHV